MEASDRNDIASSCTIVDFKNLVRVPEAVVLRFVPRLHSKKADVDCYGQQKMAIPSCLVNSSRSKDDMNCYFHCHLCTIDFLSFSELEAHCRAPNSEHKKLENRHLWRPISMDGEVITMSSNETPYAQSNVTCDNNTDQGSDFSLEFDNTPVTGCKFVFKFIGGPGQRDIYVCKLCEGFTEELDNFLEHLQSLNHNSKYFLHVYNNLPTTPEEIMRQVEVEHMNDYPPSMEMKIVRDPCLFEKVQQVMIDQRDSRDQQDNHISCTSNHVSIPHHPDESEPEPDILSPLTEIKREENFNVIEIADDHCLQLNTTVIKRERDFEDPEIVKVVQSPSKKNHRDPIIQFHFDVADCVKVCLDKYFHGSEKKIRTDDEYSKLAQTLSREYRAQLKASWISEGFDVLNIKLDQDMKLTIKNMIELHMSKC